MAERVKRQELKKLFKRQKIKGFAKASPFSFFESPNKVYKIIGFSFFKKIDKSYLQIKHYNI